jgi:hypothetical protein
MEESTEENTTPEVRKGRRTDAEIKAEGNAEILAGMKTMQDTIARLEEEREADRTAVIIQKPGIPKLQKTRVRMTNDTVRGVAHATGGASHNDFEDGTPWTPSCPDWVTETYMNRGKDTEESLLAEYLYKQAFLNDNKIYNFDMLEEAMLVYKDKGKLAPIIEQGTPASELAKVAVV